MKKEFYFLCLMILIAGCNSIRFKPPLGVKYLVSCVDGDCVCIADDLRDDLPAEIQSIEKCNNVIGAEISYYEELEKFYNDKVMRLEVCLNVPKACK